MPKQPIQQQRKNEHLFIAEKFYNDYSDNGFSNIKFIHDSLPEIALDDVKLETKMFNKGINAPFYINAMTGGSHQSKKINRDLAKISHELNIPMAVGSMSAALKFPEIIDSYTIVREMNPNGVIMANISAGHNLADVKKIVSLISADAVQIHVNTLQELNMAEGDRSFYWLNNIQDIIKNINVPVIIKEVGFGLSYEAIKKLVAVGVKNVDISGAGGTNFAQIESERNHEFDASFLEELSLNTAESLLDSQKFFDSDLRVFASGGIRQPLDAVKALRLGADYVGFSNLVLHQLQKNGYDKALLFIENWLEMVKFTFTALGAKNVIELRDKPIVFNKNLLNYYNQRK